MQQTPSFYYEVRLLSRSSIDWVFILQTDIIDSLRIWAINQETVFIYSQQWQDIWNTLTIHLKWSFSTTFSLQVNMNMFIRLVLY